jgi:hypothetical protein
VPLAALDLLADVITFGAPMLSRLADDPALAEAFLQAAADSILSPRRSAAGVLGSRT